MRRQVGQHRGGSGTWHDPCRLISRLTGTCGWPMTVFMCVWWRQSGWAELQVSDSGVGGGLCFGGQRAPQRRWQCVKVCVCLCETECVAMRPAAVMSTRSSVKKRRGWTGCLSNTLLPFSLDKRTTQGTKLNIRTECWHPLWHAWTWGQLQLVRISTYQSDF